MVSLGVRISSHPPSPRVAWEVSSSPARRPNRKSVAYSTNTRSGGGGANTCQSRAVTCICHKGSGQPPASVMRFAIATSRSENILMSKGEVAKPICEEEICQKCQIHASLHEGTQKLWGLQKLTMHTKGSQSTCNRSDPFQVRTGFKRTQRSEPALTSLANKLIRECHPHSTGAPPLKLNSPQ